MGIHIPLMTSPLTEPHSVYEIHMIFKYNLDALESFEGRGKKEELKMVVKAKIIFTV